jgi:glycosyltransferase involved in cell wall biosynthesis
MKRLPSVTAAVITLNEERMLPGLLASLGWVDEIVLVDGGSQDKTVELARAAGCRVLEHPFDTYARQRNRALDLARGDWILSIDADERPTSQLVDEIRDAISADRCHAFRLPIRSRIFGRRMRYSGTQDDRPIRLFRRGMACWTGDVHEVLQYSAPHHRIGQLHRWLEHETLPDLPAFLGKMQRYTSLEAGQRVRRGRPPRRSDLWLAPTVETLRRLIWKKGCFDGPEGWAFCLLSGVSQWVLARKHRQLWHAQYA